MNTSNTAAAKELGTVTGNGADVAADKALRRHIKAIALYRGLDDGVLKNAVNDIDDPCHQRVLRTFFGAAQSLDDPAFQDDTVAAHLDGAAWHGQRCDVAGDVRLIYDAMVNVVLDLSLPIVVDSLGSVMEEPFEDDNGIVRHAWCVPDACWAVAKRAVVVIRELH